MLLPLPSSTRLLTSTFQVLPLAAARYNDFAKGDSANATPFSVLVLADGFYLISGFLNVILYAYIRPDLLPHDMDCDDQSITLDSNLIRAQSHLGNNNRPSPVEPNSGDPPYAAQEMVHQDLGSSEGHIPATDIYDAI
jgi:hypothetical protein